MLSSKWLYVAGQVMYTPLVLIFCWMAVHEFYSAEVTVGWSRGGKLPPAAWTRALWNPRRDCSSLAVPRRPFPPGATIR